MNLQLKKTYYFYVPILFLMMVPFIGGAQTGPATLCKNASGAYAASQVNYQIRWRLFKFVTASTSIEVTDPTGVATINLGGGFNTWIREANLATFTFQVAGKYRIQSERRNWWHTRQDNGNEFVNTDVLFVQPTIDFLGVNNVCSGVTLSVDQPQVGATYTWNTLPNPTVGPTALYTFSSGVTQAFVTATAAGCSGSFTSNSGDPRPPEPLGGTITGEQLVCTFGQASTTYFLSTTQCSNPIIWGCDDPNVVINPGASSGTFSSATFTFPNNGFFNIFADIKGFGPNTLRVNLPGGVEVVSGSDPRCDIFFLKSPSGGGTESSALKVQTGFKGNATLYPNPVSDVLRLDQLQDYNNLRVVDQYGKVLNTQVIGDGETQKSLNVAQFANGLYLIQFTNKTGEVTTKKFQVMH